MRRSRQRRREEAAAWEAQGECFGQTFRRAILAATLACTLAACGRYPEHPARPTPEIAAMDRTALHRRDPAQDRPQAEIARAAVGVPVPFVQWGETIGTVTITELKLGKRSASPALGPGPLR